MEWFVQLHKKICDWEWYTDIPTCKLFFHILLKCNYKEAKWKWKVINPWEFITSLEHLSLETGLTRQQVRTAINKLKSTWEITHYSTNEYTTLALNNWESYNTRDNIPITNEQQTNNKRITTTNKNNKEYKENKEYNTDTYISNDIWSNDLVPKEKIDNRNKWTQRIIDIIKDQVQQEWFIYDSNTQDRYRANIIAKRQSDWGEFIKETPEEQEEVIIRWIISYSLQNEYVSKILSARDFHEKWKRVANAKKQEISEAKKAQVQKNKYNPTGNPLLNF